MKYDIVSVLLVIIFLADFREKTACIAVELILLDSMVLDLAFSFSFRVVNTLCRKETGMQEKFLKIICYFDLPLLC